MLGGKEKIKSPVTNHISFSFKKNINNNLPPINCNLGKLASKNSNLTLIAHSLDYTIPILGL